MDGGVFLAGQAGKPGNGVFVAQRQAAVDALHQLAHGGGNRLTAAFAGLLHGGDHAVWCQEGVVVGIHDALKIRRALRAGDQVGEGPLALPGGNVQRPLGPGLALHIVHAVQLPADGLDHPQTHDVFQVAVTVPGTALVGEVLQAAGLAGDGLRVFHAQQAPGAAGQVHRIVVLSGYRQEGGAGVVGGRQHHGGLEADGLGNVRPQRANCFARHGKSAEQADGQIEPFQQLPVPLLCGGVDQAGAGGIGVLLLLYAGQQVVEVVGNHQ